MNPLLLILNPRDIRECVESIAALDIDKAWLTGYSEYGLISVIADLIDETDYSHYLVLSDDAIASQHALEAVLELLWNHPVATGFSNLDCVEPWVNLAKTPLIGRNPGAGAYNLYQWAEVLGYPSPVVPTYFAGMCLTGMSRELWQQFPFDCYNGDPGNASDFSLCLRLQDAEIPIVAAREGFVYHVKELWSKPDQEERKKLLIGKIPASVRIERCD